MGARWRLREAVVNRYLETLQYWKGVRRSRNSRWPCPAWRLPSRRKVLILRLISFADRVAIPTNVLVRFLDQESVLLNLNTERYFGLDSVGTRMWQLVTSAPTIDSAYCQLIEEFDADPETLRSDLSDLLNHLIENGLIAMQPADVGTTSAV